MTWRLQIPFSGGSMRALSRSELRGADAPLMRAASSARSAVSILPTSDDVSSLDSAPASAGAFSSSQIGAHRGVSLPVVDVFLNPLARVGSDKDAPPFPAVLSRSSLPTSNGRSGRMIWLWQMGGHAPIGFLHQFYYDTLANYEGRR